VLYLTFSQRLCNEAREFFRVLAPAEGTVVVHDFSTFVATIIGRDVRAADLDTARGKLASTMKKAHNTSGFQRWLKEPELAYNELRAHVVGRPEVQSTHHSFIDSTRAGFPDYRARRSPQLNGTTGELVKLADSVVLKKPSEFAELFPELNAAWQALQNLRNGDRALPEELLCDRIVLDEVQDLTPLELAVVLELARRIASVRDGVLPFLIIAGDEGQTVRPTDFDFGELSRAVNAIYGVDQVPSPEQLAVNIRSPYQIAAVLDRADGLYKGVPRRERPAGNARDLNASTVQANVLHTSPQGDDLRQTVEELLRRPSTCVIRPGAWNSRLSPLRGLEDQIDTPDSVKGLEFQTVCVLDAGHWMQELSELDQNDPIARLRYRISVDRLRVALSRATQSLVIIDPTSSTNALSLSLQLLGLQDGHESDFVLGVVGGGNATIEEQVEDRLDRARRLVADQPADALRSLHAAMRLLHQSDFDTSAVQSSELLNAWRELLQRAAWNVVLRGNDAAADSLLRLMMEDERLPMDAHLTTCLDAARRWAHGGQPADAGIELLRALHAWPNRPAWVMDSLQTVRQTLVNNLDHTASDPALLSYLLTEELRDLMTLMQVKDPGGTLRRLRLQAWPVASRAGSVELAMELMARAGDATHQNRAMVLKDAGLFAQALTEYELAADLEGEVFCLRQLQRSGDALKRLEERRPMDPLAPVLREFIALRDRLGSAAFQDPLVAAEKLVFAAEARRLQDQWKKEQLDRQDEVSAREVLHQALLAGLQSRTSQLDAVLAQLGHQRQELAAARLLLLQERQMHEEDTKKSHDLRQQLDRRRKSLDKRQQDITRGEEEYLKQLEEREQFRREADLARQQADEATSECRRSRDEHAALKQAIAAITARHRQIQTDLALLDQQRVELTHTLEGLRHNHVQEQQSLDDLHRKTAQAQDLLRRAEAQARVAAQPPVIPPSAAPTSRPAPAPAKDAQAAPAGQLQLTVGSWLFQFHQNVEVPSNTRRRNLNQRLRVQADLADTDPAVPLLAELIWAVHCLTCASAGSWALLAQVGAMVNVKTWGHGSLSKAMHRYPSLFQLNEDSQRVRLV
jgi:hypothetical protein